MIEVHYVPTLAVRASEMRGLEYLPDLTKANMLPCFLLAPWMRSETLDKTIARIEQSFPHGNYLLDIDQDYAPSNEENPAFEELKKLKRPDKNFSEWINFIAKHDRVWPCLQLKDQSRSQIYDQIRSIQELGKSFCLRTFRDRSQPNLAAAVQAINDVGTSDCLVILEGGWARDVLQLPVWYSGLIKNALADIKADIPIVVSSTSIPKQFSNIVGVREVGFANRELLARVRASRNRGEVIYGDWGSTRPRENSGGGGVTIPPRIDYAKSNSWWIYRNPEEDWTFQSAAIRLVSSPVWEGNTGQWGEQMIAETAVNQAIGINSAQKNVASRVNLHLHRQAFYGRDIPPPEDFEDIWEDL